MTVTTTERTDRTGTHRVVLGSLLAAAAAAVTACLLATPAAAAPAQPGTFTLHQPDGSDFRARRFGDEWYNGVETRGGFTVLQGPRGWWRYAVRAKDGSLVRGPDRAGIDDPSGRRHLRDRVLAARAERRQAAAAPDDAVQVDPGVGGPAAAPSLGTEKSLVILAQFLDQSSLGTTAAQWNAAYFGAGKSVRDYYTKASNGLFTLSPAAESSGTANDGVVGWVTLPMNHPNRTTIDSVNRAATRAAIIAADPYVNYAAYDTNADGVVTNHELHITVIAAGYEASCCSEFGKSVWGHRWSLQAGEVPVVDGKSVGGWGYTQFGEMHGTHMATLGIMAHEIGHDLELPDLYDADQPAASSDGIGKWSLMAYGSWLGLPGDTFGTNGGQTPPLPDAWSRWFEGWITPTTVTGTQTRTIDAASSGAGTLAVQLLDNPSGPRDWTWQGVGSGEYFLVENRQPLPGTYDASLPGSGLLVLHVDESRGNNLTDTDRLVDVEEADGLAELDVPGGDNGDAGDLYPGTSGNRAFNAATNPNSNLVSGATSGVAISGISDSASTMSATFTAPGGGGATPPPNDMFAAAEAVTNRVFDTSADTTAATVESGEFAQSGCPLGATTWYRYQPSRDVRVTADTSGSTFDTVLNLWQGSTLAGLTARDCSDDAVPGSVTTSTLDEFVAQAGQTYYFQAGGYYDEAAGTVAVGSLQLHVRVRPVNDDFAQATTIGGDSGTTTGNNVNASDEAGEPDHAGQPGSASVWWRWVAPSSGSVTVDTLGSAASDTLLAVYTGNAVGATTVVTANDDIERGVNLKSRVTFNAVAGTTYMIAVDGYSTSAANRGELTLSWATSEPRNAVVDLEPVDLPGQPFGYVATVSRTGAPDPAPVTVDLVLPSTTRLTETPAGCVGVRLLTCDVGPVTQGAPVTVDLAVLPLTPGPHTAQASLTSPDDILAGNSATAVAGVETVCDRLGTTGRDVLTGTDDDDVLCGLGGADTLTGNGGDDIVFGGPGVDTASYADATGPMVVNLNFQTLESETAWPRGADAADGNDLLADVEAVRGSRYADQLLGRTRAPDSLVGLGGNDLLYGYGAADVLSGSGGRDRLFGGSGNDRLVGGTGKDRLDGGPRRDLCRDRRDTQISCER